MIKTSAEKKVVTKTAYEKRIGNKFEFCNDCSSKKCNFCVDGSNFKIKWGVHKLREEQCMEVQEEINRMIDKIKNLDNKYLSQKTRADIQVAIEKLLILHEDFEF